jgi:DNA repair exonuclease SbcCD ATPase subunit
MSSVNDLTIEALIRERDEAIAKAATYERDWYEAKSEFGTAAAKLRERVRMLQAEVEMLRGVGCRETKEGEPESGPCSVCLKCAEERGERKAQAEVARLREAIAEVAKWRESSYGGVLEIMEFASEVCAPRKPR